MSEDYKRFAALLVATFGDNRFTSMQVMDRLTIKKMPRDVQDYLSVGRDPVAAARFVSRTLRLMGAQEAGHTKAGRTWTLP
jgi:hypothetical protein